MSKIVEISTDILELAATIQEGLEHLSARIGEGHFEDTYYLFLDMVKAFSTIYDATKPLVPLSPLGESQIEDLTGTLISAFDDMNQSYEKQQIDKAQQDLTLVLFPAFIKWKAELDRCLHPLVDS